jgi:hypothetical protein
LTRGLVSHARCAARWSRCSFSRGHGPRRRPRCAGATWTSNSGRPRCVRRMTARLLGREDDQRALGPRRRTEGVSRARR